MANTLVLRLIIDDKGNKVLEELPVKLNKAEKATWSLGKTLERVFVSAVFLNAISKFKEAISGTVSEIIKFEQATRKIEGIAGVSGNALKKISKEAIDLSNNTEFLTSALQESNLALTKMGLAPQIASQALPILADMATATGAEIKHVSTVVLDVMRQFGMNYYDIAEVQRAANVLFQVEAQTSIDNFEEVAEAMKYVGPVAHTLGISFEEVSAILGILANRGIKGSLAGNAMKNMFLNILKASPGVNKELKTMNIETMSFAAILEELQKRGVKVTDFLATFQKRAVVSALILAKNSKEVDDFTLSLERQDIKISDVADTIRKSWINQLLILKNAFINVGTTWQYIMENNFGINPVKPLTQSLIDLQKWMIENKEQIISYTNNIVDGLKQVAETIGKIAIFGVKNFELITSAIKLLILQSIIFNKHLVITKTSLANLGRWGASSGLINVFKNANIYAMALITSMEAINYFIKDWEDKINKRTSLLDFTSIENVERAYKALYEWSMKLKEIDEQAINISKTNSQNLTQMYAQPKISKEDILSYEADVLAKKYGFHKDYFLNLDRLETSHAKKGLIRIIDNLYEKERLEKELLDKAGKVPPADTLTNALADSMDFGEKSAKTFMEGFADYIRLHSEGYSDAIARLVAGIHPEYPRMLEKDEVVKGYPSPEVLKTMTPKQQKAFGTSYETAAQFRNIPLDVSNLSTKDVPTGRMIIQTQIELHDEEIEKLKQEKIEIQVKMSENIGKEIDALIDKAKADEDVWLAKKELMMDYFNSSIEAASIAASTINDIDSFFHNETMGRLNKEMEALNNKHSRQNELAKGSVYKQRLLEQQQAKEKATLQKKLEKEEKEYKEKQKQYAIVETLIKGAVAFINAMNSPYPLNIALPILVAASTTASVAMIAAQKYVRGGLVEGDGNSTSDSVRAMLSKGEYIVNAERVKALGGGSGVNRLIEEKVSGMTQTSNRNINIRIDTLIGEPEYERKLFVRLQKESLRW